MALLAMAAGRWPEFAWMQPLQLPAFGLWIACWVLANVKLTGFRCPRCGHRFNSALRAGTFGLRGDAGRACGHCGLPLYGRL